MVSPAAMVQSRRANRTRAHSLAYSHGALIRGVGESGVASSVASGGAGSASLGIATVAPHFGHSTVPPGSPPDLSLVPHSAQANRIVAMTGASCEGKRPNPGEAPSWFVGDSRRAT